jgi:hypothetical protein
VRKMGRRCCPAQWWLPAVRRMAKMLRWTVPCTGCCKVRARDRCR